MNYVYVLRSESNGKLYIGYTQNLKKRFSEHNKGYNRSTKSGKPWRLHYYEAHNSTEDAKRREKYLKTTQGRKALKRMTREELRNKGAEPSQRNTTGYA